MPCPQAHVLSHHAFYSHITLYEYWKYTQEKRRQRQCCYRNTHKHKTPDTMCFHLAMKATGRGNAASCGRIGGEGGGHSECALCVYSSSYCCSMCLFYWCCLWGYWIISALNVDTPGFGLPRGPPCWKHCTLFLTPVICDRVGGFRPWAQLSCGSTFFELTHFFDIEVTTL